MPQTFDEAISRYGRDVHAKLTDPSAVGEPEDQLRGPLEELIKALNVLIGPAANDVTTIGEVRLPDLMSRPDYAVTRDGLIGFIELKAAGKGSDPRAFAAKSADRLQWEKLKSLPNIMYTDGNGFTLWRDGGKKPVAAAYMEGDVRTAGKSLMAGPDLLDLFKTFYDWKPIAPSKPRQLAETAARLCRLLRAQVVEQLARSEPRLTGLKADWGNLLFPEADNDEFADGYAQAVTFGLLMARARDIPLADNIEPAAKALRKTNTLIGSALSLFTEEPDEGHPLETWDADEIFVIDCSPEGHQPAVGSRIFQSVQQPVCIVMALRRSANSDGVPAIVHFRRLSEGGREHKLQELLAMMLDDSAWTEAPSDWRAPFLPAGAAVWVGYPALEDLFDYAGSGVMTGRTWVIAPDAASLSDRWRRLRDETDISEQAKLFHPHEGGDRSLSKVVRDSLSGYPHPESSVAVDKTDGVKPLRYSFRSFDRQWILPDNRLINRANPNLWRAASCKQVFLTAPHDRTPTGGPAITFAGLIPDLHHYHGRGGRVFPLYSDAGGEVSNVISKLIVS